MVRWPYERGDEIVGYEVRVESCDVDAGRGGEEAVEGLEIRHGRWRGGLRGTERRFGETGSAEWGGREVGDGGVVVGHVD